MIASLTYPWAVWVRDAVYWPDTTVTGAGDTGNCSLGSGYSKPNQSKSFFLVVCVSITNKLFLYIQNLHFYTLLSLAYSVRVEGQLTRKTPESISGFHHCNYDEGQGFADVGRAIHTIYHTPQDEYGSACIESPSSRIIRSNGIQQQ